jgi:hypothetical protein
MGVGEAHAKAKRPPMMAKCFISILTVIWLDDS